MYNQNKSGGSPVKCIDWTFVDGMVLRDSREGEWNSLLSVPQKVNIQETTRPVSGVYKVYIIKHNKSRFLIKKKSIHFSRAIAC